MSLEFQLTFAGIPFVTDDGVQVPIVFPDPEVGGEVMDPKGHDCACSLMEQVDRMIPFHYLQELQNNPHFPGRNLGEIAYSESRDVKIRVGDWYYPTTASRWSVFRGLATSSQVKAMLATTGGYLPKTFVMKVVPSSPANSPDTASNYTLSTSMYMLPPRPLGEDSGDWDGLYLVTLVDERYFFQGTPSTLKPKAYSTWDSLIDSVASDLGITLTYDSVPDAYGRPEPDSHLWASQESSPLLLDALAFNVGRVCVRKLDGTYKLESVDNSVSLVGTNRKTSRHAGGDLFYSGTKLPAGSLRTSRNAAVPANYKISYPYYVRGDDPVPHFLNPRYEAPRPSHWYEDGLGSVYTLTVPVSSGGPYVSGLTGVSDQTVHDTAKALIDAESQTTPTNYSGLVALGLQTAQDFYGWQVGAALDEVYEGTVNWTPEGFHDIVWTYSCMRGGAFTRVMKSPWNQIVKEFQHSTPPVSGYSQTPKGVGGPSVALTVRDQFSGYPSVTPISTSLTSPLTSGGYSASLAGINYLPTNERWKGQISGEIVLFEGTSGGTTVDIVQRGIDGTVQTSHNSGDSVTYPGPNVTYGTNLMTFGRGQFVHPESATSGGITGVKVIPQTQTVAVVSSLSGSTTEKGRWCWDGRISAPETFNDFDSYWGGNIYVIERDDWPIRLPDDGSPGHYNGQFVGWSNTGARPVYLVDCKPACCHRVSGSDRFLYLQTGTDLVSGGSALDLTFIPVYITDEGQFIVATSGFVTTNPPPSSTPLVPSDVPGQEAFLTVIGPKNPTTSTWTTTPRDGYEIDETLTFTRSGYPSLTTTITGVVDGFGFFGLITVSQPNSPSITTTVNKYTPSDPLPGRPNTQLITAGPNDNPPFVELMITYQGYDDNEWSLFLTVGERPSTNVPTFTIWTSPPSEITTSVVVVPSWTSLTVTWEKEYSFPEPGFRFNQIPVLVPLVHMDFFMIADPMNQADVPAAMGPVHIPDDNNAFFMILENQKNDLQNKPAWHPPENQEGIGFPVVGGPTDTAQAFFVLDLSTSSGDLANSLWVRVGDYQEVSRTPPADPGGPAPEIPTIPTACGTLPSILNVTVTNKTGDCTCLPDNFMITWDEMNSQWIATLDFCSGGLTGWTLSCDMGGTSISDFSVNSLSSSHPDPSSTLSPVNLIFSGNVLGLNCTGTATFTVTE